MQGSSTVSNVGTPGPMLVVLPTASIPLRMTVIVTLSVLVVGMALTKKG